ncbi:AMP-binding protein [Aeromicrobium sp. YIM 150415]|uniref:AMP-binding protein n=1 Tax=Aeromicrobium sp. YIM 150415 TaxID=2803912 RepID=UPI001966651C|nr:AMP-binding protein [Aeromicrobium sp. YIM 150415]MBM9464406.1 AMP-binding protein [Aeromicrobium sp. YIM 150415]
MPSIMSISDTVADRTTRSLADLGGGTLGGLLSRRAATIPDKLAVVTAADRLTYGELDQAATQVARGLLALGLRKDDAVAIFLRNRIEWMTSWLGIARGGLVTVPVNTAYKGAFLEHALSLTKARAVVTEQALLPALAAVLERLPELGHVVLVDPEEGHPASAAGRVVLAHKDLITRQQARTTLPEVTPYDVAQVGLTSGTSGRSKGVVMPHLMLLTAARENATNLGTTNRDVIYTCTPLFHGAAQLNMSLQALYLGATVVVGERFSASGFWKEVRAYDVTLFNAVGSILPMLLAQPPSERDREHRVNRAFAAPAPPEVLLPFEERFGVHLVEGYGMTEIKNVTYNPLEGRKVGSVGKPTDTTVLQVQDEHGTEVPVGQIGEICYRPRQANIMFVEYLGDPAATREATRDLWFRTGDLGYVDADGYYYFVDRSNDALRRRGENVSSYEVESVLAGFPGVLEAAAVATPSELGEDDILAVVETSAALDLEALFRHCDGHLPHFMVPRYYRIVLTLPRTPTGKIQKAVLREEGRSDDVWDAEMAGLRPTRPR